MPLLHDEPTGLERPKSAPFAAPESVVASAVADADAAELQAKANRNPQHVWPPSDRDYAEAHDDAGAPEGGQLPPPQPQCDDLVAFMGIAADLDGDE